MPTSSYVASQAGLCSTSIVCSSKANTFGQCALHNACSQFSTPVSRPLPVSSAASTGDSCYIAPTRNVTNTAVSGSTVHHNSSPLRHQVNNLSNTTLTPTASSHSQVLVGSNVFNFATSPKSVIPCSTEPAPNRESSTKPFVLKMQI